VKNILIALGTNIGEMFDISKLRYHRIVIMTDADVDGAHIRTLLLTLFYRYFPELIKQRHVYIAQPPLFRLELGREARYCFSEAERDQHIAELLKIKAERSKGKKKDAKEIEAEVEAATESADEGEGVSNVNGIRITRYKGLGEMNAEQLWETTMDPAKRMMKVVDISDAQAADQAFDTLMGSEVAPRKKFIQTHASSASLDL
jgi:DNA gyrase subunit B